VNVTKLCKDGGKEFKEWGRLDGSKNITFEVGEVEGIPPTSLLEVYQSGKLRELSGTYAHPHLVPHIASWISPSFAVKVSRIVNDHLVREYREQIREKTDKIDELMTQMKNQNDKLDAQNKNLTEQNRKIEAQNKKLDLQTGELSALKLINLKQTSLLEDQRRMLQVVNENVIESVSVLHHVSDKSVPYERLKDELTEQLVIVNTEEDKYAAIRAQSKYVEKKLYAVNTLTYALWPR
jgi:hypothetical protein